MKKTITAALLIAAMLTLIFTGCAAPTPAPAQSEPAPAPAQSEPAPAPAQSEPAPEPEPELEPQANVVYDTAFDYFKNFPSDSNVIRTDALMPMMDAEEDMLLLDIRRPDDYNAGHLKGAVNLSFFDMSISDYIEVIPDDRPVMVYCYTGQTASQVTALLNIAGKTAKNVVSGFNNGISKTEGFEAYIETDAHEIEGSYDVDPAIKEAIKGYFETKMSMDGTATASFNISPETVNTIVEDGDDSYYILSIRRSEDYAAGHLKGAANIPYGQGMEQALSELPKDKVIIVYCYSGQTSSQTTAVLRMMGFEAFSMSGGMGNAEAGSGWLGAGYPVEAS